MNFSVFYTKNGGFAYDFDNNQVYYKISKIVKNMEKVLKNSKRISNTSYIFINNELYVTAHTCTQVLSQYDWNNFNIEVQEALESVKEFNPERFKDG